MPVDRLLGQDQVGGDRMVRRLGRAVDSAGDEGRQLAAVTATIASSSNTKPSPTRPSLTLARPWSCSRLHDLRHFMVTQLISAGVDMGTDFARSYPSTPPATLLDPVAGLAGNLAFDHG
jgi:hypothetical protein